MSTYEPSIIHPRVALLIGELIYTKKKHNYKMPFSLNVFDIHQKNTAVYNISILLIIYV